MSERFRVLGSGEVVERDDPNRNPRLVGQLSWPGFRPESPVRLRDNRGGSAGRWDGPDWGELVADCPCEDCQAQRAAAAN
jgi:hypothetical protein